MHGATGAPVLWGLEGEEESVSSFVSRSGLSYELLRTRFMRVVELEMEWSIGAKLHADDDSIDRVIICGDEVVRGLQSWTGALNSVVPG